MHDARLQSSVNSFVERDLISMMSQAREDLEDAMNAHDLRYSELCIPCCDMFSFL